MLDFITQTGVTFPIGMNGQQTAQSYNAENNSLILVDQQGIVRAMTTLSSTAAIDSMINVFVENIESILNSSEVRKRPSARPFPSASTFNNLKFGRAYDLLGKRLDIRKRAAALQIEFSEKKYTPVKSVIFGRK